MAQGDLCSLAEVREHLQIDAAETDSDAVIQSLITRLSRTITREYRREFAKPNPETATRRVKVPAKCLRSRRDGAHYYMADLAPYDLRTTTSVKLHPETAAPVTLTAGTDYVLEPVVNVLEGVFTWVRLSSWLSLTSTTSQRFGFAYLEIAGNWGFDPVPDDVKEAAILAVVMHVRGEVQAFGSALQPNSLGAGVNDAEALPPGVRGLLKDFKRDVAIR